MSSRPHRAQGNLFDGEEISVRPKPDPKPGGRHRWGDPSRKPLQTDRRCVHCGCIKRTHHEGKEEGVLPWKTYHLDGETFGHRPPCPGKRDG